MSQLCVYANIIWISHLSYSYILWCIFVLALTESVCVHKLYISVLGIFSKLLYIVHLVLRNSFTVERGKKID